MESLDYSAMSCSSSVGNYFCLSFHKQLRVFQAMRLSAKHVLKQDCSFGIGSAPPWLRLWLSLSEETLFPRWSFDLSLSNVSIHGKRDKHSRSASAIIILSTVSITDNLLSTLLKHQPMQPMVFLSCQANA